MPRARALPPLPTEIVTTHGPVPVVLTVDPAILDDNDFGCWNAHLRVIYIRKTMHRTAQWLTLFHEQCHANFDDVDVGFTHEQIEVICNMVAAGRFRELQAEVAARPVRKRTPSS